MNFKAQLTIDCGTVFATYAEATQYAQLTLDGFQPLMSWRVVDTNQPVTHRMTPSGEEDISRPDASTASSFAVAVHYQDLKAQSFLRFATYQEADAHGRSLVWQKGIRLASQAANVTSALTWAVIPTSLPVTARMTATGSVELV